MQLLGIGPEPESATWGAFGQSRACVRGTKLTESN
jgi:hypothetical protein